MKGFRFYREYNSAAEKRRDEPNGNVFARELDVTPWSSSSYDGSIAVSGVGSILSSANSPCMHTNVSLKWLEKYTKRISEAQAREIHPNLFIRLEQD